MDILTALVFSEVLMLSTGVAAFLLWRSHRDAKGLAPVAYGCMILSLGIGMLALRTPVMIMVTNTLLVLGSAMVTEGMVQLAGGRPRMWLVPALTGLTALLWPLVIWLFPDNLILRMILVTILRFIVFGRLLVVVLRVQKPLGAAHAIIVVALIFHICVLLARMILGLIHPDPTVVFRPTILPWFLLEGSAIITLVFFSIMMMVSKRLDDDLKERTHSLMAERQMHQRLRHFLSVLGHELRTPLAIIDRSAELSLELLEQREEPVAKRLTTIRGTVDRARAMVDHLLLAERAELDTTRDDPVDLIQVARDLMRVLAQKYAEGRIMADLPEGTAMVRGDREMLAVAISNLLDNALKFSPKDAPVRLVIRNGKMIRIAVTDQGIGFPPQQIANIGQRFFRAGNAHAIPGTGLGMSIVRAVVDQHRGSLTLSNNPEGGAEVAMEMPAASA